MNVTLKYQGTSELVTADGGAELRLAPNLARERVSFDGEVRAPVRFREAMSALHDVVVGDLRFSKKNGAAYRDYKERETQRERDLEQGTALRAKQDILAKTHVPPPDLEPRFRAAHKRYWSARDRWIGELARTDWKLFRRLVPLDPVVTVAPDTVFFEAFSRDESSYGCLFVDRGAFEAPGSIALGTTNVDYSIALYDHMQSLRTYRPTRLLLDPGGASVDVLGRGELREQKIDLPSSWLRGFGQISAATGLASSVVTLPVDVVYGLLAFLKTHRERKGPRSIRFDLVPGKPPRVVLEPWNIVLESRGPSYEGERPAQIKVWGRRRLAALARTLPLADRIDVLLLGSGLPSIWIVSMGDMRFVLALSGWTTNDWTRSAALDLLAGDLRPDARTMERAAQHLTRERAATLDELARATEASRPALLGSLHRLAVQGQLIYDFGTRKYRYRSILPVPLAESAIGPENAELVEGRTLILERGVRLERDELLPDGRTLVVAKVGQTSAEALLDADGRFVRAKCTCTFFHRNRLRAGPCRHLLALRFAHDAPSRAADTTKLIH